MKKTILISIALTIGAVATGFVILTIGFAAGYTSATAEQSTTAAYKTQTDVVEFCQQLSATSTVKGWDYTDCLSEVGKTIRRDRTTML